MFLPCIRFDAPVDKSQYGPARNHISSGLYSTKVARVLTTLISQNTKICVRMPVGFVFDLHYNPDLMIKVFISQEGSLPDDKCVVFQNSSDLQYHPYRDDFGPMNMASTIQFVKLVDEKMDECKAQSITNLVYSVGSGRRALSNAVMLLGSYMIDRKSVV